MTYQIGRTYTLCGMEMTISYWDGDCPVFSYYVDKKEFLYRDNELEGKMNVMTKTIEASENESPNDICFRIGIETIREPNNPIRWRYNGKTVDRPMHVQNFESALLENFNIEIVYKKE